MNRRFFLFAAPAIVAAPSLMRVSTLAQSIWPTPSVWTNEALRFTSRDLELTLAQFSRDYLRPQAILIAKTIDQAIGAELRMAA